MTKRFVTKCAMYSEHATSCNSDIGMTDGSILDFQISASSYHWKYPPKYARPLLSGWCAASTDTAPFIMVNSITKICNSQNGEASLAFLYSLRKKGWCFSYIYITTLGI